VSQRWRLGLMGESWGSAMRREPLLGAGLRWSACAVPRCLV
jgi:hypothetical protein